MRSRSQSGFILSSPRLVSDLVTPWQATRENEECPRLTFILATNRLFVDTEAEARNALVFLAQILWDNHGLTLQEGKTEIVSAQAFQARFSWSEQDQATASMQENLEALLAEVGIDTYDPPDFDELPDEVIDEIEEASIWQLLREQLESDHPDNRTVHFGLQQIRWWNWRDEDELILDGIRKLSAMFPDAIRAATASEELTEADMQRIAGRLLALVSDPAFAHLEYFRAWILSIFSDSRDWNHSPQLQAIHRDYHESFTRSAAIRALGVAGVDHWFRSRRGRLGLMDPWERRAFLAGAACLPADEQRHWYASVRQQLDDLELAVVNWARAVPQGTRQAAPPRVDNDEDSDDVELPDWLQDDDGIPF